MRSLALLLIVANALYFAWAKWIDAPLAPTVAFTDRQKSAVAGLVLASERPADSADKPRVSAKPVASPRPDFSNPSSGTAVAQAQRNCISVGPFQDLSTVAQTAATLKTAGLESQQRLEQGDMWVGYWLSLQGLRSREEAERAVARLKEHGIADVYIMPGSDPPNVVSLGVFKDQDRAQRRLEEIKQLDLPAQLSDRTRAGSAYWLDVSLTQPEQKIDPALLGGEPGKILRLEMRACPASISGDNG